MQCGLDSKTPMKVEVTPDDVDTYKSDNRGRINLGTEYADREIEIAILNGEDDK